MDRYNKITGKNKREIVLLRAFPCVWGKCTFCDYIEDNCVDEEDMNKLNFKVLENITGKFGVLEVINSGSCFEIPKDTLKRIKEIIEEKNIKKLFLESHWCYKNRLDEMREYFGVEIIFKIGIETFDSDFRNRILNKNIKFNSIDELKEKFQSICLMVGIKGQTKEMIKKDMDIALNNFPYATINIWTENSTGFKRDSELINWFREEYKFLKSRDNIEVLFENTDFGVGD